MRRPPELNLTERDLNKVLAETLDLVQHEARTVPASESSRRWRQALSWLASRSRSDATSVLEPGHERLRCHAGGRTADDFNRLPADRCRRTKRRSHRNRVSRYGRRDSQGEFRQNLSSRSLRRKSKAPASGWPQCTASWICMADGLRSKARNARVHDLWCACPGQGMMESALA